MLPSKTEMKILKLLQAKGDMYGLEMVKTDTTINRGSVYVILGRLEEQKWVKSRLEEKLDTQAGMARRLYTITGHGRLAINATTAAENVFAGGSLVMGG